MYIYLIISINNNLYILSCIERNGYDKGKLLNVYIFIFIIFRVHVNQFANCFYIRFSFNLCQKRNNIIL